MMLYLSDSQAYLVQKALEKYQRETRDALQNDTPPQTVRDLLAPDLFQLDLLVTWIDRQREVRG